MSTTFPAERGRSAGGPTAAVVAGASTRAQRSHGEDRKASGERLAESEPHSTSSVSGPSIPSFGARNVIAVRRPRKANDRGLTQHQWRVLSVGGAGAGAQLSNAAAMLPKSASCRAVHATPRLRTNASAWRQTLLASDQHIMRAGERHEPLLPESKPSPGTRHRYRADGEALAERKHRYRPAALSAILLRHSCGRLKNGELQCVSTSRKLRAISSQAFSLLACGGLLSAELLHLLFER